MCFHRWSFIERGLFENFQGLYERSMRMEPRCKEVWFIWGVMLVSLGLRLVCLSARLTIMVSCSLEAFVLSPALFSSSPPSSFLPPLSSPPVVGATGIAYHIPFRNSFRFLCNKLKKLQHYCNYYSYINKMSSFYLCVLFNSVFLCLFAFYYTDLKG